MTNVKPNDMAKIVGLKKGNGTIVEVLGRSLWRDHKLMKFYGNIQDTTEVVWDVRVFTGVSSYNPKLDKQTYLLPGGLVLVPDKNLRRVPDSDPEIETETTEEIEEYV